MLHVTAKPYEFECDPKRTALLVIDFQNDFLLSGGFGDSLGNDVSLLQRAVAPTKKILELFRKKGLFIIHTREGHLSDYVSLEKIHYDAILPTTKTTWSPLRDGVDISVLHENKKTGYKIALLKYQKGASVPRHLHEGDEHIFVLEGSQSDEKGTYHKGEYVFNKEGTTHRVWSDEGCIVLIHWQKPVKFI